MVHFAPTVKGRALARLRVPLGWLFGLAALYLATPRPTWFAAGVGMAVLGESIRLWAAGHLEKKKVLARGGPYAWTRNPLYFGSLWVGLGFALATGRWELVLVVALMFVFVYAPVMMRETRELAEVFPAEYARYEREVPLFWPRPPGRTGPTGAGFRWSQVVKNREHWTVLGCVAAGALIGARML